ncbi:class I SAM-dependent methyltransferase [Flavobacteriaceae bacterium]|nr:class I SAM-dependent methyltransferase [Flavobacteriaceae bacterium]
MSDVNVWNKENLINLKSNRHFPSEMVLRATVSPSYFSKPFDPEKNKTVLDIGCLFANNLVPFWDRGMKLYGTEVTEESVAICKEMCKTQKIEAEVKKGFNTAIPFDSDSFDLVLSIATIHYEESLDNIRQAFKEFRRVTKKNGTCIIKTVAPEHTMFIQSKLTNDGNYMLNNSNDLRDKQRFYFFEDVSTLVSLAKEYFPNVEVARITERYPNNCLDFYLLKCDVN